MNVKHLKQLLQLFDDDDEVVMSKDGEGNSYSPLYDIEGVIYVPITKSYGEVYPRSITAHMESDGFTKDDLYHDNDGINAIVLYPSNQVSEENKMNDNIAMLNLNQNVLDMLQKKVIEQADEIKQLKDKIQKQEEELDNLYRNISEYNCGH